MIATLRGRGYRLCGYINVYYPPNDTRFAASGIDGEIAQIQLDMKALLAESDGYEKANMNLPNPILWPPAAASIKHNNDMIKSLAAQMAVLDAGMKKCQTLKSNLPDLKAYEQQSETSAESQVPSGSASAPYSSGRQPSGGDTPFAAISPLVAFALPAIGIAVIAIFKRPKRV